MPMIVPERGRNRKRSLIVFAIRLLLVYTQPHPIPLSDVTVIALSAPVSLSGSSRSRKIGKVVPTQHGYCKAIFLATASIRRGRSADAPALCGAWPYQSRHDQRLAGQYSPHCRTLCAGMGDCCLHRWRVSPISVAQPDCFSGPLGSCLAVGQRVGFSPALFFDAGSDYVAFCVDIYRLHWSFSAALADRFSGLADAKGAPSAMNRPDL